MITIGLTFPVCAGREATRMELVSPSAMKICPAALTTTP